jgi:hypothetical protein
MQWSSVMSGVGAVAAAGRLMFSNACQADYEVLAYRKSRKTGTRRGDLAQSRDVVIACDPTGPRKITEMLRRFVSVGGRDDSWLLRSLYLKV